MAEIRLETLAHRYSPHGAYALKPLDMTWRSGGTYALLGPSGCGKSTMLNIISGLIHPSEGRVLFDGRDVAAFDTGRRKIAQVFQVPVIYRSMTVGQNLGFPLVCQGAPAAHRRKRVETIADRLGLGAVLNRPANALTADQKQLVSLGRGLVREDVAAILLDEPLTVIDPQQKFDLRRILKEINVEFGVTMVLVTHDQTEAMTFAEEVIVMNMGEVVQAGTPRELFEHPATRHVGSFIGAPAMNFLAAVAQDGQAMVPGTGLALPLPADVGSGSGPGPGEALTLGFRPEHLQLAGKDAALSGTVTRIWFEGLDEIIALSHPAGEIRLRAPAGTGLSPGDHAGIVPEPGRLRLYVADRLAG
ncbi:ABC transporter ATP-binding protein [Paracoccus sp. IB05]|uniref:ABC transporter ATP-binding protein n=1 Tax=Paracoccus sp. IB05 TaxID=2779367 RepID=UPI0018E756E4|nr:ABC transporter ATP-binding protein [Paracoccus sp. IB05]MBJ2151801.1 ABC transporter ATP-binding protein [Paracoccus sp. IB05]